MCSLSYVHVVDVKPGIQAARYILLYGEDAQLQAEIEEECPQYKQRVLDIIIVLETLAQQK
jgi:hypothetical protein